MAPRFTWSDDLSEEQDKYLMRWAPDVFGGGHIDVVWAAKDHHLFVWEEDQLVGHLGVLVREASVAGEEVRLGGIGGVVIRPEWQGRGFATAAMGYLAGYLRNELTVQFGFIFVHQHRWSFYERLGWERISNTVHIEQRGEKIISPVSCMILPCADRPWPSGDVDLNGNAW